MSLITILRQSWSVPTGELNVPTDDRRVRRFGLLLLLVTFGGFGMWSYFAPLDSAVVAPGVVTASTYRKTVQHLEGGIVRELLIHEGDRVKAGQPLLKLDDTQARAQLEIVRVQNLAQRVLEARLLAEQDDRDHVEFPADLKALEHDPRTADLMRTQLVQFDTRRKARLGEIGLLEQRVEQLLAQQQGQKELAEAKQRTLKSYEESINDLRKLFASGMGDKVRLREYERAASEIDGERAEALSNAAAARVQAAQARQQILQLTRDFQKEVADQLREARTRLYDIEQRIHALEDTLARTEIRAPAAGQIVGLAVHNVGAVLTAGARILDIVPLDDPLVIEAQVQPIDIDRVTIGQPADVRFTNFHDRTTPVLDGTLQLVSADRITDPATHQSYYLVRVEVSAEEREKLSGRTLLSGMPTEVLINTGERTALEYFLRPLTDTLARSFTER
ncbi:HlyD family type I secretion periplasmic adaptor subunit [Plasticicumulans sp.]|uniref:HlyD family type I secretion periplasmic adaptor subunit n=1 Tax=Plasticicumulans sp. TaxID=2307179 RepID=UPI00321FE621